VGKSDFLLECGGLQWWGGGAALCVSYLYLFLYFWVCVLICVRASSSKSALHGLIHWLAGAYSKSGVTVNGVAPALIQDTTMLPGNNEELAKSMYFTWMFNPVRMFADCSNQKYQLDVLAFQKRSQRR
jgi:hypothetical protein